MAQSSDVHRTCTAYYLLKRATLSSESRPPGSSQLFMDRLRCEQCAGVIISPMLAIAGIKKTSQTCSPAFWGKHNPGGLEPLAGNAPTEELLVV